MTDFATMTNAQLNRWAAERDGWTNIRNTPGGSLCGDHPSGIDWLPGYADRADLAIALLGRWGYEWCRVQDSDNEFIVYVWPASGYWGHGHKCYESPDCDTARALVIAACGLKESEEV
jgi:hypothetical protein